MAMAPWMIRIAMETIAMVKCQVKGTFSLDASTPRMAVTASEMKSAAPRIVMTVKVPPEVTAIHEDAQSSQMNPRVLFCPVNGSLV